MIHMNRNKRGYELFWIYQQRRIYNVHIYRCKNKHTLKAAGISEHAKCCISLKNEAKSK